MNSFLQKTKQPFIKWAVIGAVVFFSIIPAVFAAWDGTTYEPGETLEPECAPTDPNCKIEISSFGSGATYAASEQGIHLDDSSNVFSVTLDGSTLSASGSGLKISNSYGGQTSITTLGTVATGTWQGTPISATHGGTGITATPSNGQIMIGNGAGFSLTTFSGSNGISITNGAGTVGLSFNPSNLATLSSADNSDLLVIYDTSSGTTKTISKNDLLAGAIGGFSYQGSWDADTNTPNIGSTTPSAGTFYIVGVAGTTLLGGITDWDVGDWAIYNGTNWEQVKSSSAVGSVFGRTGIVTADAGDYTAAQIINVATGTISSTNVQDALNEVATESEHAYATGTTNQYFRGDKTWQTLSTAAVAEDPSHLYYTTSRARTAFSAASGLGLNYSTSTGTFALDSNRSLPFEGDSTGDFLSWNGTNWVATSTSATINAGTVTTNALNVGALNGVLFGTNGQVKAIATSTLGIKTDSVAEGSLNLYYTDSRADARVMLGLSGATSTVRNALSVVSPLAYNQSTGIIGIASGYDIPSVASSTAWNTFYTAPSSRITAGSGLSWSGNILAVSTSSLGVNSDTVTEGSVHLFYTDARADARVAAGLATATSTVRTSLSATAPLSYDSNTGVMSVASGFSLPSIASTTAWNTFYTTPSSRITAGGGLSWNGSTLAVGTSSLGINSDTLTEGSTNLFYSNARVDARITSNLAASSSEWNSAYQNRITSASSPLSITNNMISLSTAGDWTGTLDGQEGSFYLNRANMTGTQAWSTIGSTPTTIAGYGITDAAPTTRSITASGLGITGGGNLSANRTISLDLSYLDTRYATSSSGVLSFAGRTGAILPQSGDYTTSLVSEGSNLYYTDARADARVALGIGTATSTIRTMFSSTATGLTYTPSTGIFGLSAGYSIPLTASTTAWNNGLLAVSSQWITNGSNIYYNTGNVGISTSTPLGTLSVKGAGTTTGVNFTTTDSNNLRLFTILDSGNVGIGTSSPIAKLSVVGSVGSNPFVIASSSGAQLITVTQSGNLGIGTTTPSEKLSVNGNLNVSGTITSGSLSNCALSLGINSSGSLVCALSDRRLKNVQSEYMGGLDAIEQLQPVVYTWKEDSGFDPNTPLMGFIAQDVAKAIPEAGFTYDNGYMMYNHLGILGAAVNAIKELNEKIKTLALGTFDKITTKEVHTDKLCIGDTCVSAQELQEFVDTKKSEHVEDDTKNKEVDEEKETKTTEKGEGEEGEQSKENPVLEDPTDTPVEKEDEEVPVEQPVETEPQP